MVKCEHNYFDPLQIPFILMNIRFSVLTVKRVRSYSWQMIL